MAASSDFQSLPQSLVDQLLHQKAHFAVPSVRDTGECIFLARNIASRGSTSPSSAAPSDRRQPTPVCRLGSSTPVATFEASEDALDQYRSTTTISGLRANVDDDEATKLRSQSPFRRWFLIRGSRGANRWNETVVCMVGWPRSARRCAWTRRREMSARTTHRIPMQTASSGRRNRLARSKLMTE